MKQQSTTIQEARARAAFRILLLLLFCMGLVLAGVSSRAEPKGMTVVSGSAQAQQQGSQLQITTSQNAFLQWSSFNIAAGESTVFKQPSASSIVWNNILDGNPSAIYGSLSANGVVVLENQSGFFFGPNAFVKAAGLVVTTAAVDPGSSGGGMIWSFSGPPAATPIVNYGHLETASGGSLFLIAKQIENHGTMATPDGTTGLVAGQEVLLCDRPDGLSLSSPVRLPAGSVDNQGRIIADAGQVLLQAQTVNQSGLIQANSVRQKNGFIELFASDNIQLSGTSVIQANGDATGPSQGGSIVIKSGDTFSDNAASRISAAGGAHGGNGGEIEISAPNLGSLLSDLQATAVAGSKSGNLVMDPANIVLGGSGVGSAGSGSVNAGTGTGALNLNVNSAFQGFSQITLQASQNITLNSSWNLASSTGKDTEGCQLTLQAGNSISLSSGVVLDGGNNWSLSLTAGANFNTGQPAVSGVGTLALNGSSTIQTGAGNISVLAGNGVTVGSGAIRTTGGGSIGVTAMAGNVNCGANATGFDFSTSGAGFSPDPSLGGISTAGGGNVSIQAGGNIQAFLPPASGSGSAGDAGTGAFGQQPGNVTVKAGGNVLGHYVEVNGTGIIQAGGDAGTTSRQLALSLVKGSWSVTAADSIVLQEVRNPNGVFNARSTRSPLEFLFDYDGESSVCLDAGNSVVLSGALLPRTSTGSYIPVIYPPILIIEAGAGGVSLATSVNLFPSPVGSLTIHTTGGGNLGSTTAGDAHSLVLSDSNAHQDLSAAAFTEGDPGLNTLHLNDLAPVLLNISGSVSDLNLFSPKPVSMTVGGNILDSSITAENFRPADLTSITAAGSITYRNEFNFITLLASQQAPNFAAFTQSADPAIQALKVNFTYDPTTKSLGFAGRMTTAQENALLTMTPSFLDAATVMQLYTLSQGVPTVPAGGITVAGPGTLQIDAASLDLGVSHGIQSIGYAANLALAPYTGRGADIDISLTGDLNMFSTTIISQAGGNINITSGGAIDIGSQQLLSSSVLPRGIVSLDGGNISAIANGDVEVDGSRIATYDGGNIAVESLQGNVDAGTGGTGYVTVSKPYLNSQGTLAFATDTIPGSGILATSYPELTYGETASRIGNITIETPRGNISASAGGVVQFALGPVANHDATINLNAGSVGPNGTVYLGNVNASGSGVIGDQVNIKATGSIEGLVVASQGVDLSARQNVNVTVLSQGAVSVSAGGAVSGTIAGTGNVDVSGNAVSAALLGGSVNASGNLSGAAAASAGSGSPAAAAATATQAAQETAQADLGAGANGNDSDQTRRKRERPVLSQYVGRVTVVLPAP